MKNSVLAAMCPLVAVGARGATPDCARDFAPILGEESPHLSKPFATAVGADRRQQVSTASEMTLNRPPSSEETEQFANFAGGLDTPCRVLLNSNEFLYVD